MAETVGTLTVRVDRDVSTRLYGDAWRRDKRDALLGRFFTGKPDHRGVLLQACGRCRYLPWRLRPVPSRPDFSRRSKRPRNRLNQYISVGWVGIGIGLLRHRGARPDRIRREAAAARFGPRCGEMQVGRQAVKLAFGGR